jgi:solute carrier family 31 (copper transporter), member 1
MQWTPSSPAGYAGTWIFLFLLGIMARGLTAGKVELERYWIRKFLAINVVVNENGESKVLSGARVSRIWRVSVELPRAAFFFFIAGVYYLLYSLLSTRTSELMGRMIAVMTMNVGYFFAVLAGLFFGEFAFGRFISGSAQHAFGGH